MDKRSGKNSVNATAHLQSHLLDSSLRVHCRNGCLLKAIVDWWLFKKFGILKPSKIRQRLAQLTESQWQRVPPLEGSVRHMRLQ